MKLTRILLAVMVVYITSCRTSESSVPNTSSPMLQAMPRAFVYKMRADYSQFVPVTLCADRTIVVAYPDRTDIANMPVPTPLVDGWWLDNRGINGRVAFTTWTYAEYIALPTTPTAKEIMAHIKDATPLIEAWECAPRHTYAPNEVKELNALIEAGFPGCTKIHTSR